MVDSKVRDPTLPDRPDRNGFWRSQWLVESNRGTRSSQGYPLAVTSATIAGRYGGEEGRFHVEPLVWASATRTGTCVKSRPPTGYTP